MSQEDLTVRCVEDALCRYALHLLEISREHGWDLPAALLAVKLTETPRPGDEPDPSAVSVTFSVEHLGTFENFSAESLVGIFAPEDAVGVALVCECWTYHPDRPPEDAELPPSRYEDSLEIKVAHVVLRDGTEVLATIYRDAGLDPSAVCTKQYGCVPQSVRRVLGLPSDPWQAPPTMQDIRSRVLPWVGLVALRSVHPFAHTAVLADIAQNSAAIYEDISVSLGLLESSWEDSLIAVRRTGPTRDNPMLADLDLLPAAFWVDPPLWALTLGDLIPTRPAASSALQDLVRHGGMEPATYAKALEILFDPRY
jgi:hypothetical protein